MTQTTMERRSALDDGPTTNWRPTGRHGVSGEWDGSAWTGRSRPDAPGATPPAWRMRVLPFFRHAWFWLLTGGLVTLALAGALGNAGVAEPWWRIIAVLGLISALSSMIAIFWTVLRFGELPDLRLAAGSGLAAGAVAFAIAVSLEGYLEPALGVPMWVDLWLSGPVEETCKLLVPVILLFVSSRLFGDPRAGVLMVLLSGAVFGVMEGYGYLHNASGENEILFTALIRGFGELTHCTWTATAAALIWLAAHRAKRVVTLAGFTGWVVAMLSHSLHDGFGAGSVSGSSNTVGSEGIASVSEAIRASVLVNLFTLIAFLIAFVVLRYVLRELVPPTAIADNPPRWRPRLKKWGVPIHVRHEWAKAQREASAPRPDQLIDTEGSRP